jgi:predicted metal-binding membrane protein
MSASLEKVLKRDRIIVLCGLALLTLLAWAYLLYEARQMNNNMPTGTGMNMPMDGTDVKMSMSMDMAMPQMQTWQRLDLLLIFIMWAVMMVGMMLPTAAPMILLFTAISRKRREQQRPFVSTGTFVFGYLTIWTAFAAIATLTQWRLHSAALISPMMVSTSAALGGGLLIGAGIFQWTPLKRACLSHCRSPLDFITTRWREGKTGAFLMGLNHGAYCVGCCWVLMSLLFVAGVMNLLWIAVIAAFVLVEKVAPPKINLWISRSAGVALVAWGIWLALLAPR